ncbi:zinc finger protein 710 [Gouania willdenowi]|uniref:Zinc finger protein 710-like n=1 Tax=Gouania willdenowi TaxID=441366 RepID=A0A8C5E076_GOUWI|nr:zinc finger protein 710-like [Gouania willdenowi]XP_028325982.1 zinc finger protein 710-like [Gouania willdenowi]XP_028325984.1 zinc finger protein 710-like [Gouania willdenowi]
MSIEYTLDIQLTELGFPDLLEPDQAPNRETGAQCGNVTSMSTANKQRREHSRSASKTGTSRHALTSSEEPVASPQPEVACQQPNPAPSQPHGPKESRPSAQEQPTSGQVSPQSLKPNGEQGQDKPSVSTESPLDQQHVDDDSDDSDVSEGFEEEEIEEDDCTEEEEGLNSELNQTGNFRCSVCNLQVTSEFKLQDHMNLHTGARPYGCAECGKRFCQIYNYRVHLRTHALTHQAKMNRLQQCRICRVYFDSEADLRNHLSSTHFESKFYECDLCKRVFTSLKDCKHHVELHSCMLTFACDICGRNFSSQKSLVHHQKKHCHRHFKCTDCSESFAKKNALLKHSFSHLGLLPYTCVRCHSHFRLARLYRRHKCEPQRIHCMACLREFVDDEEFQQHKKDTGCWGNQVQSVIKDEVRCLECGEKFDTSGDLKKHAGAHQRVLKCAECGERVSGRHCC